MVELKQVVMKLYTDLKAVGCEDNLEANPFILNKVVARLPRFWQNKYSENKTELLRAAAASASPQWTAVSEFLKSEALRIETDMPSSLDCNTQGNKRQETSCQRSQTKQPGLSAWTARRRDPMPRVQRRAHLRLQEGASDWEESQQ